MSKTTKNKQILFFKSIEPNAEQKNFLYILMSFDIGELEFSKAFPNTQKVTQAEFDKLYNDVHITYEIVHVGDADIIDEHFSD